MRRKTKAAVSRVGGERHVFLCAYMYIAQIRMQNFAPRGSWLKFSVLLHLDAILISLRSS